MVEIEVRKSEAGTEKVSSTNLDVNEIINKVRDLWAVLGRCLVVVSP